MQFPHRRLPTLRDTVSRIVIWKVPPPLLAEIVHQFLAINSLKPRVAGGFQP
jgi:hypothetical protein